MYYVVVLLHAAVTIGLQAAVKNRKTFKSTGQTCSLQESLKIVADTRQNQI